MLLVIDAGNTNIVFAVYDKDTLKTSWRCRTDSKRTADEYAAFLYQLFTQENLPLSCINNAIISSVVPDANYNLRQVCRNIFNCEALIIGLNKLDLGIEIKLLKPEEVGADRLVNAIAVLEHYEAPAIIIDFGTATTFDVIDLEKAYIGGVIAPGINLSLEALYAAAAKLPKIGIKKPEQVIGNDTITAMRSGIYYGYISMIEGMVEKISDEMGTTPYVIATGGLAPLFAENTSCIKQVDDELTLKGLLSLYKKNA